MPYERPKSQFIKVQGEVKWSQLQALDTEYHNWHITIYPTPESLGTIRDLQAEGMKNVLKKDDENRYYVKFTRYPYKDYKDKGGRMHRIEFAAPTIIDKNGSVFRDIVGRSSHVTIDLEVYQHNVPGTTKKAKAARLVGVKVDELVPYSRNDFTPQQEATAQYLEKQPAPQW